MAGEGADGAEWCADGGGGITGERPKSCCVAAGDRSGEWCWVEEERSCWGRGLCSSEINEEVLGGGGGGFAAGCRGYIGEWGESAWPEW